MRYMFKGNFDNLEYQEKGIRIRIEEKNDELTRHHESRIFIIPDQTTTCHIDETTRT